MSSIRSASSNTRYVTLRKLVWQASNISISRPGVAMTISTPARSGRISIERSTYHADNWSQPIQRSSFFISFIYIYIFHKSTSLKITNLWSLRCTTVYASTSDFRMTPKLSSFFLNLNSQFPGRCQDKHDRTFTLCWTTQIAFVLHKLRYHNRKTFLNLYKIEGLWNKDMITRLVSQFI